MFALGKETFAFGKETFRPERSRVEDASSLCRPHTVGRIVSGCPLKSVEVMNWVALRP